MVDVAWWHRPVENERSAYKITGVLQPPKASQCTSLHLLTCFICLHFEMQSTNQSVTESIRVWE